MEFTPFDEGTANKPSYFQQQHEAYYDQGVGVPTLERNNMTIQDIHRTPFLFLQNHHKNYRRMAQQAVKGIQCQSELSVTFFSKENIKRIQKKIQREILRKTKGKYKTEDQDEKDLRLVMRAVYIEFARDLPNQIIRQVKKLNERVVQQVVPSMIANIKQYYGYLKDISTPLQPLPLPMNVNNAGRRTLPSLTTSFEGIFDYSDRILG